MTSGSSDRLLIILPAPKPTHLLTRLEKKFPNIEIEYIQAGTSNSAGWGKDEPDKGKWYLVFKFDLTG